MRLFFAIALPLALAGCGPALSPPGPTPDDCATRAKPELEIGTGADAFQDASKGLLVEEGIQGGYHIWVAIRTQNLGPGVVVSYAIKDAKTGELVSQDGLVEADELALDGDLRGEHAGIRGFLEATPESLFGREVELSATVTDGCEAKASAKAKGKVTGYDSGS